MRAGVFRVAKRIRFVGRSLFAILAGVAIVFLVRSTGVDAFVAALHAALPWIPLLLLLEGVRIAADLVALRGLCGDDAQKIPLPQWIRLHIVANTALVVLPGGRIVSEGMKIARLRQVMGLSRATALVGINHALTLVGVSVTSFFAAIVAWYPAKAVGLALVLLAHAVVSLGFAAALLVALRRGSLPIPVFSWRVLAVKLVNRAAQVVQLAIVFEAVANVFELARALLAGGVSLLGGVMGELSIAQLGCTEGVFVASASALSLGVSGAVATTSIMRVVQLIWCLAGGAMTLSDRSETTLLRGDSHAIEP